MAKVRTTEDQLALLRTLREHPDSPQTIPALEELLKSPRLHGIVLKSIVAIAEHIDAKPLAAQLASAALSLTGADAGKRDPGCEAKIAILKTLLAWDQDCADLYLTLSTYRQMTPTFGNPVDVAAEVRGLSALGISAARPVNAIFLLIDLLCDSEKITRAYAATALGNWRGAEALPLLHLKAKTGDAEPEVVTEVLAALLRHDPRDHLNFITTFLDQPETIEPAAVALGQSKLPAALAPLTAVYSHNKKSRAASTLLMSISLLRNEDSIAWLLNQLPAANAKESLELFDALHIHRGDSKTLARIEEAVAAHPALRRAYDEVFK